MKWLTFKKQTEPGFRINLTDILFLFLLGTSSVVWRRYDTAHYYYLLPLYVGLTFFLFCNVFRVGNRVEPIWYVTFVIIVLVTIKHPLIFWLAVLFICEPVKWGIIIWRVRRSDYRGISVKTLGVRDRGKGT